MDHEQLEFHGDSDQQLLELKAKMGMLTGGSKDEPRQLSDGDSDEVAEAEVLEENSDG